MNEKLIELKYILIILILTLILSTNCYAQKVDSVAIIHPETREFLQMIYTPKKMGKKLDKLNEKYKTDLFILLYYFDDNTVIGRRMKKDEEIQKPEIQ